jgi:hypothetical protein
VLPDLELLFAFPEYGVKLDTWIQPSQNDIFAIAKTRQELVAIAIEGKVDESFDFPIGKWNAKKSKGKDARFDFLLKTLGLTGTQQTLSEQKYQLFHRTASAVLMAERLHCKKAMTIVHSFSGSKNTRKKDFDDFVKLFDAQLHINPGEIKLVKNQTLTDTLGIELFFGWIADQPNLSNRYNATAKVPDGYASDLDQRFWKAAQAIQIKPSSYTQTYPHFIRFFQTSQPIDEANLTIAIHFVYGWMPTIFNFGKGVLIKDVLDILNRAKAGLVPTIPEFEILKKYLNNSLVGTSKLLHFIRPDLYPIWDSKICRFILGKEPHEYRVGKIVNYIDYLAFLNKVTKDPTFVSVHQKINQDLNYTVTALRAAELIMFTTR